MLALPRLLSMILLILIDCLNLVADACGCFRPRIKTKIRQIEGQNFSVLFNSQNTVKYIEIKNYVFTEYKESVRNFMILGAAYNIVGWLNFIGYYLPLTQTRNAWQFQEMVDYFAQFSEGVDRVNMQQAIFKFDLIRERTLALWYE